MKTIVDLVKERKIIESELMTIADSGALELTLDQSELLEHYETLSMKIAIELENMKCIHV